MCNNGNITHSQGALSTVCWTLQTLKCYCSSSFHGLVSDEPSHLQLFFQNLWHLHLFLLFQKCPNINEDTQQMLLEHILIHTLQFSEQIIFQIFLCACVPSSGDKSTWNFPFQVRNCQKHKVTPVLAEEQTLLTADSLTRRETEIRIFTR